MKPRTAGNCMKKGGERCETLGSGRLNHLQDVVGHIIEIIFEF